MKKNKIARLSRGPGEITPEQALDFLEGFRKLKSGQDEPTEAISIRVPANILRAYRVIAKAEGRSYQTMMVQALRASLVGSRETSGR